MGRKDRNPIKRIEQEILNHIGATARKQYKDQGLSPMTTLEAIGVSLRTVRSYWNQEVCV